jgi:molybdopterin converting factor subunit 1
MASGSAVRVLLFAAAREAAGTGEAELPVEAGGTTVAEMMRRIVARWPALEPYARALRIAVNGEYKRGDDAVRPGDEVAVIPPVAGG